MCFYFNTELFELACNRSKDKSLVHSTFLSRCCKCAYSKVNIIYTVIFKRRNSLLMLSPNTSVNMNSSYNSLHMATLGYFWCFFFFIYAVSCRSFKNEFCKFSQIKKLEMSKKIFQKYKFVYFTILYLKNSNIYEIVCYFVYCICERRIF